MILYSISDISINVNKYLITKTSEKRGKKYLSKCKTDLILYVNAKKKTSMELLWLMNIN